MSVIYHIYGKSFIEIIPLPVSCTVRDNTLKQFFDLNLNNFLIFSLINSCSFFGSVMKNCIFNFEKLKVPAQ